MTESERYTWWDDGEAYSNYIRPAVTKRLAEYEDIGTVEECRENKNFLEFLYNTILPNEMEQYLSMYHASEEKGEGMHE